MSKPNVFFGIIIIGIIVCSEIAMANCSEGMVQGNSFCIDKNEHNGDDNWGAANDYCMQQGKRLCTQEEHMAAYVNNLEINWDTQGQNEEWLSNDDSCSNSDKPIMDYVGENPNKYCTSGARLMSYRCCSNKDNGQPNAKVIVIPLNTGGGSGSSKFIDGNNPKDAVYTDGNIGIGTMTPTNNLHLITMTNGGGITLETSEDNVYLILNNTGPNGNGWRLASTSEGSSYGGSTGNFAITNHGMIPKFVINNNGNVGINTTNPASKLNVSGLPTTPPDGSGNAGVVCVTNSGNFWLDNDGTADCQ